MGRARTMERRKEREQQKKRQRQMTLLIGGVIVAVVAFAIILLINQPAEAPIPTNAVSRYDGIPQGKTEDGFPTLGNESAPVKVTEFSSFDCPHCAEFHEGTWPQILERIKNNEVFFTYVPHSGTGGIANGLGAAQAAICAGEQGKFWPFHDALFDWQVKYLNTAFSQNRLVSGVANLNLDKAQWDSCIASAIPGKVTDAARNAFQLQNVAGTPALYVNGEVVPEASGGALSQAIDAALAAAGGVPAPVVEPTTEATIEPTQAVNAEATAESTPGQ
ncbi:MAG: thioredoxin domain-containing protein [Anaerolineae bacterium]